MLNIKQGKPRFQAPKPLERLSRALEKVLLFTRRGWGGVGERSRAEDAVCKIPPLTA